MVGLISQIKNKVLRAFVLRLYNTLVAALRAFAVLVAGTVIAYFSIKGIAPTSLSVFESPELWDFVIATVIFAILTAIAAGGDKANRVSNSNTDTTTTTTTRNSTGTPE